jgi:hypothetical protein
MAGLLKEVFTTQLMEDFYPEGSFLSESTDMSEFVQYDKINLGEAGINPNVLKNNLTYPVATASRTDTPLELILDVYDTENTIVRNIEQAELSYNKVESVIRGHRQALQTRAIREAAHNWCPITNGTFTPIIPTTGAPNGTIKRISFEDLDTLEAKLIDLSVDASLLNLSLSTKHQMELRQEDRKLYKEMMKDGRIGKFKVHFSTVNPLFSSAGVKRPYGAVAAAGDNQASFAWLKSEVMRADGTIDIFGTIKDPGQRGDTFGMQKRGLYLPIRNKYLGAIYSAA